MATTKWRSFVYLFIFLMNTFVQHGVKTFIHLMKNTHKHVYNSQQSRHVTCSSAEQDATRVAWYPTHRTNPPPLNTQTYPAVWYNKAELPDRFSASGNWLLRVTTLTVKSDNRLEKQCGVCMQLTTLFSAASCTSTECNNSPGHNHWQQHQACLNVLELGSS